MSSLQFFTHEIDGSVYGAWYRTISPLEIEVIGVGLLEQGNFAGFSPESAARSMLENCVRHRRTLGVPVPSLESQSTAREDDEPADPPKNTAAPSKPNATRPRS